jgi:purine-nucleoside/S-methyl-5'-thioadenosine phosphorylase / adenosine deaminase
MPFDQIGDLHLFTFETLNRPGLKHALFTRRGGVSPSPWASLNLGGTVGDDRFRVLENKRRLLEAAGRREASLHEVWQVHSARVVHAQAPRGQQALQQADAMITSNPQVTLLMRFADCVPILLYDPVRQAIGMVHAGWLGTVRKTVVETVRAMQATFGTRPADLLAALGPSIGPDHYAVGEDVAQAVRQAFGAMADELLTKHNGRLHLDLWLANRRLLEGEGVRSVEVAEICTACHSEDWYSHRGEAGKTGRFGALAALGA